MGTGRVQSKTFQVITVFLFISISLHNIAHADGAYETHARSMNWCNSLIFGKRPHTVFNRLSQAAPGRFQIKNRFFSGRLIRREIWDSKFGVSLLVSEKADSQGFESFDVVGSVETFYGRTTIKDVVTRIKKPVEPVEYDQQAADDTLKRIEEDLYPKIFTTLAAQAVYAFQREGDRALYGMVEHSGHIPLDALDVYQIETRDVALQLTVPRNGIATIEGYVLPDPNAERTSIRKAMYERLGLTQPAYLNYQNYRNSMYFKASLPLTKLLANTKSKKPPSFQELMERVIRNGNPSYTYWFPSRNEKPVIPSFVHSHFHGIDPSTGLPIPYANGQLNVVIRDEPSTEYNGEVAKVVGQDGTVVMVETGDGNVIPVRVNDVIPILPSIVAAGFDPVTMRQSSALPAAYSRTFDLDVRPEDEEFLGSIKRIEDSKLGNLRERSGFLGRKPLSLVPSVRELVISDRALARKIIEIAKRHELEDTLTRLNVTHVQLQIDNGQNMINAYLSPQKDGSLLLASDIIEYNPARVNPHGFQPRLKESTITDNYPAHIDHWLWQILAPRAVEVIGTAPSKLKGPLLFVTQTATGPETLAIELAQAIGLTPFSTATGWGPWQLLQTFRSDQEELAEAEIIFQNILLLNEQGLVVADVKNRLSGEAGVQIIPAREYYYDRRTSNGYSGNFPVIAKPDKPVYPDYVPGTRWSATALAILNWKP